MTLLVSFRQQCLLTPDRLALVEDNQLLTYQQFEQSVDNLSGYLQSKSYNDQPIAVFAERGIEAAKIIYAILMLGGCYLPLDKNNPIQRLNAIINDASPQFIVGIGERPSKLSAAFKWLNVQNIEPSVSFLKKVIPQEKNLAAILYTSGSTGHPKGVALSHGAMTNFVKWSVDTFTLTEKDRLASLTPFHFDLSIFDLFATLSIGACVYFVPNRLTLSPRKLSLWLNQAQITTFYTVPSLLSFMAVKGGLETINLDSLRQILFAGEVFPSRPLIKLARLLPRLTLYNLYGPTETNVCCYWKIDRQRLNVDQSIPLGIPACGAQLSLTNEGQLWVKSDNNFSGYWKNGRLEKRDLAQGYATGDKVSKNGWGEYCYHGRLDRMLKCSGYRIEPAEIEAVIHQVEAIMQCAVIGIPTHDHGQRLAAVLVLHKPIALALVMKAIKQQLPAYMWPVKFKILAALPTLSNGKTDYLALKQLFLS